MPKGIVIEKKFNYFYKITNLINNKFYYGIRSCNCNPEDDPYMGSGFRLHRAYVKYGINNFEKEVLRILPTREDAEDLEAWIVDDILVRDPNCYNIARGGTKNSLLGRSYVKDLLTGEKKLIPTSEFEENSDRYESAWKGYANVYDSFNNRYVRVTVSEYRNNKDRYKSISIVKGLSEKFLSVRKGKTLVKSDKGNVLISSEDYSKNKDKYESVNKGRVISYDIEDKCWKMVESGEFRKNPERYKTNSSLIGSEWRKGRVSVKDKEGNTMSVSLDDPRYISGELVGVTKGVKLSDSHKSKISSRLKGRKEGKDVCLGRVCITNGIVNRKVYPEDLDKFFELGFYRGVTRRNSRFT